MVHGHDNLLDAISKGTIQGVKKRHQNNIPHLHVNHLLYFT